MSRIRLGKLEILQLFKQNIEAFLNSLVELFPDESDLIVLRIFFENQIPIEEILDRFGKKIIPLKDMIKTRNEQFFLNETDIFSGLNKDDKVIRWKNLWRSKTLSQEDKDVIWQWFDLFLGLAEMYQEHKQ